ncbi:hypothetical protein ACJW31_11G139300 [Castanea mollissima]
MKIVCAMEEVSLSDLLMKESDLFWTQLYTALMEAQTMIPAIQEDGIGGASSEASGPTNEHGLFPSCSSSESHTTIEMEMG